jgi:acetyl esterase/lipase
MRRLVLLLFLLPLVAAKCPGPNPGPSGLYLGKQDDITPVVTPKNQPITWGSAPVIDEHYGGTLYAGTSVETQDPRPPLLSGGREPLRLWVADPDNGLADRPAIVWVHGGGFALGVDSMFGLASSTGKEYAQRGYVSFSVEYRIDTTLIGGQQGSNRPPSLCQWVQDNVNPNDSVWRARYEQCKSNILAAQHDVQAAVRYIRAHATEYGIDPSEVAVGGFSAGAVTALHLAYRSNDVGTTQYFAGDDVSSAGSTIQAAFGASGCAYPDQLGDTVPDYIDAGDAPVSLIHAEIDGAVPYACAALTVNTARSKGLVAELRSYCNEAGHAAGLYATHKTETDEQWTTFLARELKLYTGMRPPSSEPTCNQQ